MYNKTWRLARREASEVYETDMGNSCPKGFKSIRVHNTRLNADSVRPGYPLRPAGFSLDTRTRHHDHYSAPELRELVDVERVYNRPTEGQGLVLLRGSARA